MTEEIVAAASPIAETSFIIAETSFIENQESLQSPLGLMVTTGMVVIALVIVGALVFVVI